MTYSHQKKIVRTYFSNLNINIHLFIYKKHHLLQMSYVAMYLIWLFYDHYQIDIIFVLISSVMIGDKNMQKRKIH